MTDSPDHTDSVEERLETLEAQMEERNLEAVRKRLQAIEAEQSDLRGEFEKLVEALREQGEETPHVDSAEALYRRLEALEENVSHLREAVDDLADETSD